MTFMQKGLTTEQLEFRSKVYGAIFWICEALILLWYILKSTGVIKTPLWIELLPVAIAIFGAGAVLQQVHNDIGTLKTDVGTLKTDVSGLKRDVSIITSRVDHLENDIHYIKAKV